MLDVTPWMLNGCFQGTGSQVRATLFLWDWLSPGVPAFPVTVHHVPWQVDEQVQAAAHRPGQNGWAVRPSCSRGCGSPAQLPWLNAHQGPAWRSPAPNDARASTISIKVMGSLSQGAGEGCEGQDPLPQGVAGMVRDGCLGPGDRVSP